MGIVSLNWAKRWCQSGRFTLFGADLWSWGQNLEKRWKNQGFWGYEMTWGLVTLTRDFFASIGKLAGILKLYTHKWLVVLDQIVLCVFFLIGGWIRWNMTFLGHNFLDENTSFGLWDHCLSFYFGANFAVGHLSGCFYSWGMVMQWTQLDLTA